MVHFLNPEDTPEYNFAYTPPDEMINDFLDGVGNHEIKILIGSLMLLDPDRIHQVTQLSRRINQIMEASSVDYAIQGSDIQAICKDSLAAIGQIVINKPRKGWLVHPDNFQEKLALAGLFGDWSIRWPNTSVQTIYGPSGSVSQYRSPRIRHKICEIIKRTPTTLYTQDIVDSFDPEQHRQVRGQIKLLTEARVINKQRADKKVEPTVEVLHNEYHGNVPMERLSPETQALYAALTALHPGTKIPVDKLVGLAMRIDGSIDGNKLSFRLRSNGRYPVIKYTTSGVNDLRGILTFDASTAQPITELLQGVHDIKNGKNLGKYAAKAETLVVSSDNIRTLVQKATVFSPRLHKPVANVRQHLIDITNSHGTVTAQEAKSLLMQRYTGPVSIKTIRRLLNDVARQKSE